jgi:hypothetical protein
VTRWLASNAPWLFSGIGVGVPLALLGALIRRRKTHWRPTILAENVRAQSDVDANDGVGTGITARKIRAGGSVRLTSTGQQLKAGQASPKERA